MQKPIGGSEIPFGGYKPAEFGNEEFREFRESEANPLTDEMIGVIEKATDNTQKTELRERQRTIFANLPPDFLVDLKAQIHAAYRTEAIYGHPITSRDVELRILRGAVFEMLVKYDSEISPPSSEISGEILSLISDPDRYRFIKEFGLHRNPDLAYIDITEAGQIIFRGVGEVKLGHLNARAIDKLQRFQKTITGLGSLFKKSAKELESHGLHQTATRKRELDPKLEGQLIDIDPNFKQVLIVPQNRDIEGHALLDRDAQSDPGLTAKFDVLAEKLQINKSVFSVQEVAFLAEHFSKKIDEMDQVF